MSNSKLMGRLLQSTILVGAVAAATPALAQSDVDTITVTGTLIRRADIEAVSPVSSVSQEELQVVNTVNTEDFLNTLPQAVPGLSASSNNPGNGVATADLRGLGSNRTLVLVEGRRFVPFDANGVVDLNQIPAALIERTDVVTGGASALYGSDAISGVVNFLLRDEFQGVELDMSYQGTEQEDGQIFQTSILAGGDFDDGRGNATFFAAYTDRSPVFQGDRGFSAVANNDAAIGEDFDPFGSSGIPGTNFFDTARFAGLPDFAGAMIDEDGDFAGGTCMGEGISVIDPDGSLGFDDVNLDGEFGTGDAGGAVSGDEFCGGGFSFDANGNPTPFINSGPNTSRYNYAPVNFLQLPQERYNLAGFATYDITENTELKLRGTYANNTVDLELAPTPIFDTFTFDLDNPVLTPDARDAFVSAIDLSIAQQEASIIQAQTDLARAQGFTDAEIMARNMDDNDGNDIDLDALAAAPADLQEGLDDFLASVDTDGDGDFDTYEAFIGRRMLEVGPRNSSRDQSATQWTAELNTEFDNGLYWTSFAQFSRAAGNQAQTGNVSRSAFQDALDSGECDIFGPNRLSQDCVQQIARTGIIRETYEQTVLGTQLSGSLDGFSLPTAENGLAFAVGLEYREEVGDFLPDSVLGPDVAGFNQSAPIGGRFDVAEVFAELVLPLVEGAPFAEELAINGAYRRSDYSTVGALDTFQVGGIYSPVPGYTVKASFNRAARAPNIAELFSPITNGFPGAFDPCAADADGEAQGGVQALCVANGVPAAAFNTSALQPNSQTESLFGGNPDLTEETADTFTVGLLAQPAFADGLTIKVDYYDIEIEDVISTVPVQTVLNGCFIDGVDAFCDLVDRSVSGQIEFVSLNNQNLGALGTEGIDLDADYSFDAADIGLGDIGSFGLRFIGNYRISDEFQALPGGDTFECAGTFGGRFGSCFNGEPKPEWKHTAFVNYDLGAFGASLRWRYLSSVEADDALSLTNEDAGDDLDDIGTFRGSEIDAFNYFDLTGSYRVSDAFRLRAGVLNVFDKEPPIQGDSFQEQANTFPSSYDALGRRFFVGATANF